MSTIVTTPEDEIWTVWTDLGQEDGKMIGFHTSEELEQYEHEYNVKTYGENYLELFEKYEAESEEYAWKLEKEEMAKPDYHINTEQDIDNVDDFVTELESQSTEDESDEPRWLSDEEIRQAGIKFNCGVDLDSPEEKEKTRLMWEEMQAEEDFMANLKVKTTLDDGTVLETEFKQLKNIC